MDGSAGRIGDKVHESRSQRSVIPARRASFWAAAAPLLCALHCIAAPLLILFLPGLALSAGAEYALMGVSAALAVGLVTWGVRTHHQWLIWLPLLAGLLLWGAGHLLWPRSAAERVMDVFGGVLLAGALVWNAWLRHEALCGDCGCPAHERERECCGSSACNAHVH